MAIIVELEWGRGNAKTAMWSFFCKKGHCQIFFAFLSPLNTSDMINLSCSHSFGCIERLFFGKPEGVGFEFERSSMAKSERLLMFGFWIFGLLRGFSELLLKGEREEVGQ